MARSFNTAQIARTLFESHMTQNPDAILRQGRSSSLQDAIELMLLRMKYDSLPNMSLIHEGSLVKTIKPVYSENQGVPRWEYRARFFGDKYYLFQSKRECESTIMRFFFSDATNIYYTTSTGDVFLAHDALRDGRDQLNKDARLLTMHNLDRNTFTQASGVIFRQLNNNGEACLFKGSRLNFGPEHGQEPVALFFDRGRIWAHSYSGEHLPRIKNAHGERIARRIEEVRGHLDDELDVEGVIATFVDEWQEFPERFGLDGRRVILQGRYWTTTNSNGCAPLVHYNGKRRTPSFAVSRRLAGVPVVLRWNGQYLLIQDEKDEKPYNAHILTSPGLVRGRDLPSNSGGSICLRTLNGQNTAYFTVHGERLPFALPKNGHERSALMVHIKPNGYSAWHLGCQDNRVERTRLHSI